MLFRSEMKNYFLIEETHNGDVDTRVVLYGNDVENWSAFISSTYNSYGFYNDGGLITKGDPWLLWGPSGWVSSNDALISGALYGWGVN